MSRIYEAFRQGRPEEDDSSPAKILTARFDGLLWDLEALQRVEPVLALDPPLRVLISANNLVAEQFRILRTRLECIRERRSMKSLLVTSSTAQEGKSFVAFNLAISLACRGRRKVLLVEGDLRRRSQSACMGLSGLPGFTEWRRSGAALSKFVYLVNGLDIFFLPAGHQIAQPVETLAARSTGDVLGEVSRVFDWVLVDSAPLVPLADASVLSRWCDTGLVVVRRDKTTRHGLLQALECIDPSKLVGFVLNDFPARYEYDYGYAAPAAGAAVVAPAGTLPKAA